MKAILRVSKSDWRPRTVAARRAIGSITLSAVVVTLQDCSQFFPPQPPLATQSSATRTAYEQPAVPIFALGSHAGKNAVILYGAHDKMGPTYMPLDGLYSPFPIAISARKTVYVADYGYSKDGKSHLDTSVTEWNTKHSGPIRTITDGVAYPIAIAVTAGGRLSVGNDFGGTAGTVTVYKNKTVTPSHTITQGVSTPSAVAFDSSSYVYVANPGSPSPGNATITEYSPGSNAPSVIVNQGLNQPNALALDSSQDLYVANVDTVTEYAVHDATLARTLSLSPGWTILGGTLAVDVLGNVYVAARKNLNSVFFGEIVEWSSSGSRPKHIIHLDRNVSPSITTDRYANLYAVIGPWSSISGANDYDLRCSGGCSLVEYPNGEKNRIVITKSNKTTAITGPIAIAP